MPVIYRPFLEKLGGETSASSYVGNEGELFYDPATTTLRISDGSTPGGSVVSGGGGGSNTGDITFNGDVIGSDTDTIEIESSDLVQLQCGDNYVWVEQNEVNIQTYDAGLQRTWTFDGTGTLTAPGDITLSGDVTGTSGANTLYVKARPAGNTSIQLNENVDSVIRTMASLVIETDVANADHQWSFGVYGDFDLPGNLTNATACSAINFVANSSGDGAGATTIELIPDTNLSGTDQYLIIDPTDPGHIHIRAGGTQDDSSADLFLGGEKSHFQVGAGQNPTVKISANNNIWTFYEYGLMKFPVKTWAEIYDAAEAGQRVFISDSDLEAIPANFGEIVGGGGANTVPVWSDGSNWRIG